MIFHTHEKKTEENAWNLLDSEMAAINCKTLQKNKSAMQWVEREKNLQFSPIDMVCPTNVNQ